MIDRIVESVTKELERHASGESKKGSKETAVGSAIRDLGRQVQFRRVYKGERTPDQRKQTEPESQSKPQTDSKDRRSGQRRQRSRRRTWSTAERILRRATGTTGRISGRKAGRVLRSASPKQKRQMKAEYDKTTTIIKGWKKKKDSKKNEK
jgi:hypothetical protein